MRLLENFHPQKAFPGTLGSRNRAALSTVRALAPQLSAIALKPTTKRKEKEALGSLLAVL